VFFFAYIPFVVNRAYLRNASGVVATIPVFLKRFCSIAPVSLSTHRCRPPSLINQTKGSIFKELYLKKSIRIIHGPQYSVMDVLGAVHTVSKY